MDMIILMQSVTIQFRRFFWYIRITKCDKAIFLQSATACYYKVSQLLQKYDRLLLQSVLGITKYDRLLLQSALGITKYDSYYKMFLT